MEPSEAERTILDVERLRRSTRHALNPIWFPNIAFGLFFLGTAAVGVPRPGHRAGEPVLGARRRGSRSASSSAYYARRERALGV